MIKKILSAVLTLGMLLTIVSSLPVSAARPTGDIPAFEEKGEFKYDFEKNVSALSTELGDIRMNYRNKNGGADDTKNYAEIRDQRTKDDEDPTTIKFEIPKNFTQKYYNTVTKVSFYVRATNDVSNGQIVSLILNEGAAVFSGDVTSTKEEPNVASFTSKPLVSDEWVYYEVYFKRNYTGDATFVAPEKFAISVAKPAGKKSYFDIDEIEVTEYYVSQNFDFEKETTDVLFGWTAIDGATVEKDDSGYEGSAAKITAKSSDAGISHSVCYENDYKYTFEFYAKGEEGKKIFLSDGTNEYECGTLSSEWEKFSCTYRANLEDEYSYFDLSVFVKNATAGDVFYVDSLGIANVEHNYELADVVSLDVSGAVVEKGTLKFETEIDVDSDIEVISTIVEIYLNKESADTLAAAVTLEGKNTEFEVVLPDNCADNNILAKVIYLTAKGVGKTETVNLGKATLAVDASVDSISKNTKDATAKVLLSNIRTAGSKDINGVAVLVLYDENNIIIGSKTKGFNLVAGDDAESIEITANVWSYCSENVVRAEVLVLDCGTNKTPTLANTTMKEFATLTE